MDNQDNQARLQWKTDVAEEARELVPRMAAWCGTSSTGPHHEWISDSSIVIYFACVDGWYAAVLGGGLVTVCRAHGPLEQLGAWVGAGPVPEEFPLLLEAAERLPLGPRQPLWHRPIAGWIGLLVILAVILIPLLVAYFRE